MSSTPEGRPTRTIAITGSSGLIGSALSRALLGRGESVLHLVRREAKGTDHPLCREAQWHPESGEIDPAVLDDVSVVVNLAGAGLGDRRWTDSYKATLRDSRINGTQALAEAIAGMSVKPRLLSGSAVGYYGERGDDVLTEDSSNGSGFLAELCRDWEAAAWRAADAGANVALLRTGIVLSQRGGAMGRLMPLAKFGLAGPLGSGDQYWPWITLHDHVRSLLFLIDHADLSGPVNLTGPHPATQTTVVKALGAQLHRPAILPAPTLALKVALGEMAGEILGSQRALPTVLTDAGFEWQHPDLEAATAWLVNEGKAAG